MNQSVGKLVVISGPSGTGKTTVVQRVLQQSALPLALSVSATTRPPRSGEQDGVDYHFLSAAEFARRREAGEFLECCEVFGRGHWYGTLWSEVTASLGAGKWVVLEIDVQGALQVIARHDDAVTIFLRPPDLDELERRLRGRHTETEQSIQRRLEVARNELGAADKYRYQVVNRSVEQAAGEICRILETLRE